MSASCLLAIATVYQGRKPQQSVQSSTSWHDRHSLFLENLYYATAAKHQGKHGQLANMRNLLVSPEFSVEDQASQKMMMFSDGQKDSIFYICI
eukprot:scaffold126022_cov39-Prasinocladus_malaysianus.AAC.1